MRALPIALSLCLVLACGDDKPASDTSDTTDATDSTGTPDTSDTSDADTDTPVPADAVFSFRAFPGQAFSDGPFPNQGLLGSDGLVDLAPLKDDARFATLARTEFLDRTDLQIAKRSGFGFVSSVFFPMNAEPDLSTFDGLVRFIALDGPEVGRAFPGQVAWVAVASSLSVFPAWGHYLVPGSTYGVIIDLGVKTADGTTIAAPPAFTSLIATESSSTDVEIVHGRQAFAKLREVLSTRDAAAVIGTMFATEPTMPWFDKLADTLATWPLEAPSRVVAYQTDGTPITATDIGPGELADYFGVPTAPFATMPTSWTPALRDFAALFPGGSTYTGGSFYGRIATVVNGSLVMPSLSMVIPSSVVVSGPIAYDTNGDPIIQSRAVVPFSAFFCDTHVKDGALDPDAEVPFAIFTHGGTAIRADSIAFAVANCEVGYATIAMDLPFHGGRQELRGIATDAAKGDLIGPVRVDDENVYTGKTRSDADFTPDHIGDNGGATATVGGLFALATNFDPEVLEATLITISLETYVLSRYLRDETTLAALFGVKVAEKGLVFQSLSFGTSFTTAALTRPDLGASAVVQSVGSGGMFSLNLPSAPYNASLASGILLSFLGLESTIPELIAGAHRDPFVALIQWLSQRGDPQGYAPFVLRHRTTGAAAFHVMGSGNSWDESLSPPAQLSFDAAWGVPTFNAGPAWTLDATIPGADTVDATAYTGPVSNNLDAEGGPFTAAYFYNAVSCHSQVVTPICESHYLPPYPPPTARPATVVSVSPICALQSAMVPFLAAVLAETTPAIAAPSGDCDDLYAR